MRCPCWSILRWLPSCWDCKGKDLSMGTSMAFYLIENRGLPRRTLQERMDTFRPQALADQRDMRELFKAFMRSFSGGCAWGTPHRDRTILFLFRGRLCRKKYRSRSGRKVRYWLGGRRPDGFPFLKKLFVMGTMLPAGMPSSWQRASEFQYWPFPFLTVLSCLFPTDRKSVV